MQLANRRKRKIMGIFLVALIIFAILFIFAHGQAETKQQKKEVRRSGEKTLIRLFRIFF